MSSAKNSEFFRKVDKLRPRGRAALWVSGRRISAGAQRSPFVAFLVDGRIAIPEGSPKGRAGSFGDRSGLILKNGNSRGTCWLLPTATNPTQPQPWCGVSTWGRRSRASMSCLSPGPAKIDASPRPEPGTVQSRSAADIFTDDVLFCVLWRAARLIHRMRAHAIPTPSSRHADPAGLPPPNGVIIARGHSFERRSITATLLPRQSSADP